MDSIPVYTVSAPDYRVDAEPKHTAVGKQIDTALHEHFLGETVVVRAVTSRAHPNIPIGQLIEKIRELGTDRYDPDRAGDRYENIGGKQIDFFGFRRKVGWATQKSASSELLPAARGIDDWVKRRTRPTQRSARLSGIILRRS